MALTPKQELRQSQALVMTPQLQQAIKLLQYSNLELAAFIEGELERNPLLEREEPGADDDREPQLRIDERRDALVSDDRSPVEDNYNESFDGDEAVRPAANDFDYSSYVSGRGGSLTFEAESDGVDFRLSSEISLRDHLLAQLNVEIHDPVERLIGAYLVEMVDEAGYVIGDLDSVAEALGCDVGRVEATLLRLQRFDPPGIFARNLRECLAIQLAERDRLDPAMQAFLDHLDLLAKADLTSLMKACRIDAEDLEDMIAEIRSLDPKPGHAFNTEVAQTMVPDVFVRQDPDGSWRIELNSDTLPKVLINARYCAQISGRAQTRDDKAYITENLNSANWLIRALDQRANTILRVSTEIVSQQGGFFAHGVEHMRPLTLRDIAEAVSMHESTISRVTSNKYMATPRGTYELKYFFSSALGASDGGENHAAEAVRHRIKVLIEQEGDGVLSDDRIAEILGKEGIDIARRTVAKYREALGIGSSVQRRRQRKHRLRV